MATSQDYQQLVKQIAAHHRERMDAIFAGEEDQGQFDVPEWASASTDAEVPGDVKQMTRDFGNAHAACVKQREACTTAALKKYKEDHNAEEFRKANNACNQTEKTCENNADDSFTNDTNNAITRYGENPAWLNAMIDGFGKALNAVADFVRKVFNFLKDVIEKTVEAVVSFVENAIKGFKDVIDDIF